jgi:ribosome-associated protein
MPEISFSITGEFIELYKLLKAAGLCENGGAAKFAIAEGQVRVDGATETRKAFKVRPGHRVEFGGEAILVQAG